MCTLFGYSTDTVLANTLNYNGATYNAGSAVHSDLSGAGGYNSDNYSYEALTDLSLTPFPFLDIHAGYKLLQRKMDVNNYMMDTLYTGPFAAIAVGF